MMTHKKLFSEKQKEILKRALDISTYSPEVFWQCMGHYHKQNRLAALVENDSDYKKECYEEIRKIREKYEQKYRNEGLL